ncbi:MAG: hypothetical protein JNK60_16975 [Acidobacteria bacterium]|nr:hypothetical protein [Acidobacteriota bacterium]
MTVRRLALQMLLLAFTAHTHAGDEARQTASALAGRVWHDDTPLADGSFQMTCIVEELDGKGAVTKSLVLEHRREFKAGRMTERLISALENGRDVTEKQRKAEAHPERRGSSARWSIDEALAPPLPFLIRPDSYRLSLSPAGNVLTYAPHPGAKPHRLARGSVTLDPSDGLPLAHRFGPEPLPSLVRRIETVVEYGRLHGIAIPSQTTTEGEGGFLFITKRFRITMRYRDVQLEPKPADASAPPLSKESLRLRP